MPIDPEAMKRIDSQSEEFDALKALIKQDRRLSMTAIVDDDYPSVRGDWEGAMHVFLHKVMKNRPEQMRSILGEHPNAAEIKLKKINDLALQGSGMNVPIFSGEIMAIINGK